VNIIQHPDGERKQIVLRENRVVGRGKKGLTLHYGADTLPGASGSPVFNDEFEVIGLHHAGAAILDDTLENGQQVPPSNESIRASVIYDDLKARMAELDAAQAALLEVALTPVERANHKTEAMADEPVLPVHNPNPARTTMTGATPQATPEDANRRVFNVPIEVSVRIGTPVEQGAPVMPRTIIPSTLTPAPVSSLERRNEPPDADWASRNGYQESFLGPNNPKLRVRLPSLSAALKAQASEVLPYFNFSIVMNMARKLAFFTAVNIDGSATPLEGLGAFAEEKAFEGGETWFKDDRVPEDQFQQVFYSGTSKVFDRGHLVRRLDPAWGDLAGPANDDTFHFTNCSPQHWQFNQRQNHWAGIEVYALKNAQDEDQRITVFSGPVFAEDDPLVGTIKGGVFASLKPAIRNVPIPKAFFKVIVRVLNKDLRATGFIASQEALLQTGPLRGGQLEAFTDTSKVKLFLRPITEIEAATGLDFGNLRTKDTLKKGFESTRPLESLAEVNWS
jgi:endonuclease G, mitochondrial